MQGKKKKKKVLNNNFKKVSFICRNYMGWAEQ